MNDSKKAPDIEEVALRSVSGVDRRFYLYVAILVSIMAWSAFAWLTQIRNGLGVTGMNRPVFWGIYITNFVFFVGISHAGTLISAILRVTGADWRRPITRAAEAITVIALTVGPINVFFDLGRPDRVLNMFTHGRLQSPLMWDVICISLYLAASVTYLYLPLIPDLALCRDRLSGASKLRMWFYRTFALGWQGTPRQKYRLERIIGVMAILIIPIAVSVHTVVSWVFSMAIQPMWHSTIFGPYFVMGAIFSGIASIIIVMAILRRSFHLEDYLKPIHFNNLGVLLLTFSCIWLYFTLAEYLTTFYGGDPSHMQVFKAKLGGEFTVPFVIMVLTCFVIPFSILAFKRTRTIVGTVIASVAVNIGMWLERFLIVVPTLSRPHLPWGHGFYRPSWIELSIFAGEVATFILLYLLFSRVFPVLSIWEIKEGDHAVGIEQASGEALVEA